MGSPLDHLTSIGRIASLGGHHSPSHQLILGPTSAQKLKKLCIQPALDKTNGPLLLQDKHYSCRGTEKGRSLICRIRSTGGCVIG